MARFRLCLMFVLLSTAVFLLSLNGCGGSAKSPPPGSQLIQHVVVIFQENRTPDNLFHDPVLIARGADIATSGVNSHGQTITLNPIDLANDYDLGHGHWAFHVMCDLYATTGQCKMDGADRVGVSCAKNAPNCPPPIRNSCM